MLIGAGADVNAKNKRGYTALMLATQRGPIEIVKLLIEGGADVNVMSEDDPKPKTKKDRVEPSLVFTALEIASRRGRTEIAKLLIDAGADVNARDYKGATALMWASNEGHTEIVNLLKEAGAKE